jgi:exo-beta-1,3-glucanase (GH17 family)
VTNRATAWGRTWAIAVAFAAAVGAMTPLLAAAVPLNAAGAASAVCASGAAAAGGVTRLREALAQGRFIAYVPTGLRIVNGKPTRADAAAIRDDLKVLRTRFDSLITYGAANGNEEIPTIAAALGFRALIIGVYDPFDATELGAALAAAKTNSGLVVGLSLGNEMLFFHRHSQADLEGLFDTVRTQAPHLPLATTEPFHMFYPPEATPLLQRMDFLLANVHPIFEPWFRTASDGDAAQFVVNVVSKLAQSYCGPIVVKETGIPTAPDAKGYTAKRQSSFYQELQHRFPPTTNHAFTYFSAFDAPWRLDDVGAAPNQHPAPEEAHWGLYDDHRQPKQAVAQIPPLPLPPRR